MRYLLVTNIVIALSQQAPALGPWLQPCPSSDLVLSSMVLAEIDFSIAKSTRKEHKRQVFTALLAGFVVLPFDEAAARDYGVLRAELESSGQLIGPNDLMIAAHARARARARRLTFVTDNSDESRRVPDLQVENWLRQPPV